MSERFAWVDLFSEGGPFVIAEERAFRAWPGATDWAGVLVELEAPGGLHEHEGEVLCFFEPEDPGPVQVGVDDRSLVIGRWRRGGGSPLIARDLDAAGLAALDALVSRCLAADADVVELGTIELADGLLVASWAAIAGSDLADDRAALEALAAERPRGTRRFAGGGPALAALRLPPGTYEVRAAFDVYDEERDEGGTWLSFSCVS